MLQLELNVEIGPGWLNLQKLFDDMTPIYRGISEVLKAASDRAFRDQANPASGAAWAPLSPVTIKRRGNSKPVLKISGDLDGSVQPGFNSHSAWISTNKVYAKTHFFGAKKGAFGRTLRNSPIPWGDIPARPFMGLGPEDKDEIQDLIAWHITRAAGV